MRRVAVIFTGGTISMRHDPVLGGNVPSLDGAGILAQTPGLDAIAEVRPIDMGRTPASHFSFAPAQSVYRSAPTNSEYSVPSCLALTNSD